MAEGEKTWFCYMVRCKDDSLYVGMTNDLVERIREHNWGVKSEFTSQRRPVALVWCEQQRDRNAARMRERELKSWRREKKLKLIAEFESKTKQSASGVNPSPSARGEGE